MASLRMFGFVVVGLAAAACSGSASSAGLSGGGGDAGQDASTSGGDGATGQGSSSGSGADDGAAQSSGGGARDGALTTDAAAGGDGSTRPNDGAASSPDASDAQGDVAPPPCPDVHGAYAITPVEAQGCGSSFNASATQCVRQAACGITFQSNGSNKAINGDPALQSDGAFTGAALTEGSLMRTGCTGTWDAATSTMTVDCGGTGSSQACVVSLMRTGAMCP
jgi:hypothetical protein